MRAPRHFPADSAATPRSIHRCPPSKSDRPYYGHGRPSNGPINFLAGAYLLWQGGDRQRARRRQGCSCARALLGRKNPFCYVARPADARRSPDKRVVHTMDAPSDGAVSRPLTPASSMPMTASRHSAPNSETGVAGLGPSVRRATSRASRWDRSAHLLGQPAPQRGAPRLQFRSAPGRRGS